MVRRLTTIHLLFAALGLVLLADLILPIANLFVQATWHDWIVAISRPDARDAIRVSVVSSSIAIALMTLFGVPLGYLLARGGLPIKRLWVVLVFLPMVVPDLAGGILLLQMFGPYGLIGQPLDARNIELTNNLAGIVLAQMFVAAPFVIVSAMAGFAAVDPELEQAAATLGDSQSQVFWRVSLPLARSSVVAGIMLAWIRAIGEFGATLIVAYNPHSLPVYMWVRFEADGLTGALPTAFCLVVLAAAALAVAMLIGRLGRTDLITALPDIGGRSQ